MSKVNILPPEVISKIAAGEVIERPCAAVKELVENSIDAKSGQIEIILKNAGKTLIHIKDNGSGIEKEDIEKIFSRHATSKISKASDLFSVTSLGFRGEALYSIASISDVSLKSKVNTSDCGWEIHLREGKRINLKPCAYTQNGTEIEIKELFFNTPARRKFLKSDTAELNQILNILIPYTLIHHDISFKLTHQDKTIIDLKKAGDLLDRISQSLNLDKKFLIETQYNNIEKNLSVKMVLGDINISRSKRDMQFIFVNGRPVQNKSISFHMNQIYRLIFPSDIYPFFSIYLIMPSGEIDVNIHPTKREIKIKNEQEICSIIRNVCEQALMTKGRAKKAISQAQPINEIQKGISDAYGKEDIYTKNYSFDSFEKPGPAIIKDSSEYAYPRSEIKKDFFIPENNLFGEDQKTIHEKLKSSRYIGTFINKYHLFELGTSLFLMDQHAAQERITYEKLITQMQKGGIESQNLLSPILINLSAQELVVFEEINDHLKLLGFDSTQWDENTLAIHSYPILISDPEKSIRTLLSGENITKYDHDTLARKACRNSVMSGDRLTKEQVINQLSELSKCLDPFTCPHGRPIIIEFNEDFFDKQFFRL